MPDYQGDKDVIVNKSILVSWLLCCKWINIYTINTWILKIQQLPVFLFKSSVLKKCEAH